MSFTLFLASAAVEAASKGAEKSLPEVFGWNAWSFFSQVISFSIVCGLLYKFAYNPVLTMLEQRRSKIEEGLANAEKIKAQLADATKTAEEIRTQANADAQKTIAEAQAAAKAIAEREGQRAVAQAAEIIQKAREAGEAEQKRLMANFARTSAVSSLIRLQKLPAKFLLLPTRPQSPSLQTRNSQPKR